MSGSSGTKSKFTQGTRNQGQEYEHHRAALACLSFLENPTIHNFKVQTNIHNFGKFDDFIANLDTVTGNQKFVLQLKHKEDQNVHFRPDACENENHEFGVMKYYKSYKQIENRDDYYFILCTNAQPTLKHLDRMTELEMKPRRNCPGNPYFYHPAENEKNHIYKFKPIQGKTNDQFFERFSFYTFQKNLLQTQVLIEHKFWEIFRIDNKSLVRNYIDIFRQFNLRQFSIQTLTKQILITRILDLILSPLILVPSNLTDSILDEALQNFDFTIVENIDEVSVSGVVTNSSLDKTDVLHMAKNLTFLTKDVKLLDPKEETEMRCKSGCYLKGRPICVKFENSTLLLAIRKLKSPQDNLHIVLIGCKTISPHDFAEYKVFKTLDDLLIRNENSFREITAHLNVSLQGKTHRYVDLFGDDDEARKLVKVENILNMLTGSYDFKINVETLPNPYISRVVTTTLLDISAIDDIHKDLVVVSLRNRREFPRQFTKSSEKKLQTMEEYLAKPMTSTSLVLHETQVSEEDLQKLYEKNERRINVHHFVVYDDNHLEWKSTLGTIKQLKRHVIVSSPCIKDDTMLDRFWNPINVIVALPGMGKSELLKRLQLTCPSHLLSIKVNLKEHNTFFETQHTNVETCDYFLNLSEDNLLLNRLKQLLAQRKNLIFFFDGLDELHAENVDRALKHFKHLRDMGFKIWLTSRPHLVQQVENYFNVFSVQIGCFSDEEQKKYVQERVQKPHLADVVVKNMGVILGNTDILEVPLQLYMVTEIVNDHSPQFDINMFVWTKMFSYFIDKRYHDYFKKRNCNHCEDLAEIVNDAKRFRIMQYQIAALKIFFGRQQFLRDFRLDDAFVRDVQTKGDFLGVVSRISDDGVFFHHNFFAEYFAASWLTENKRFLEELLFKSENVRIRNMFDLIIAEDCPAHVAVLNGNVDKLRDYKDKMQDLDKGGRSATHLAFSQRSNWWVSNTTCLERNVASIMHLRQLDGHHREILDILVTDENLSRKDALFNWTPLEYATKTCSLLPFEVVLDKFNNTSLHAEVLKSDIFSNAEMFLHTSAIFSYPKIFETVLSKTSLDQTTTESLLFLAVEWNSWTIVKLLLENKIDIECRTKAGKTSLHVACAKGHVEVVILLLVKLADVNALDDINRTPLHLAVSGGHNKVIKKLFQEVSIQVNARDKYGRTPLHLAVKTGNLNLVMYLLDHQEISINIPTWNGWTPLHFAVHENNLQIVELLLDRNAKFQIQDECGMQPLHVAASIGSVAILQTLLMKTNNANEQIHDGRTCLHLAAESGHGNVCRFLLDEGADVTVKDKSGRSVLHLAVIMSRQEVVELLVAKMSDFSVVDNKGYNCLHWAAEKGNSDIVKSLLSKMAHLVDVATGNGYTALHWAATKGHDDIVNLLLDNGADVDAQDKYGKTAQQHAASEGHTDTARLLSSRSRKKKRTD